MAIDLDGLERLAAQATPGPWKNEPDENFFDHDCQIVRSDTAFVCEFVTEANAAYIVAACNSLPTLIAENRALRERVRELERQREEAVSYILSNESASMIDCRMCFFVSYCACGPKQCEPDREMCVQAVRKAIEEAGE